MVSLSASAGLGALQMLEQLFGLGVVRGEFQGALGFGTRQIWFFLLEIDAREHGSHESGVASVERGLKLLYRVIELAAPMSNFAEAAVSGGIRWLGAQDATKFIFG